MCRREFFFTLILLPNRSSLIDTVYWIRCLYWHNMHLCLFIGFYFCDRWSDSFHRIYLVVIYWQLRVVFKRNFAKICSNTSYIDLYLRFKWSLASFALKLSFQWIALNANVPKWHLSIYFFPNIPFYLP